MNFYKDIFQFQFKRKYNMNIILFNLADIQKI